MQARRFFRRLGHELIEDRVDDVGAMMAYYAIIALFPMAIFVLSVALAVLPADMVRQGVAMAAETVPPSVRGVIVARFDAVVAASGAGFAILGAALALWGASRGAVALTTALNMMAGKQDTRPWWKRQLIAFAVTIGVAVLMVVAIGLLVVGRLAGHWLAHRIGLGGAFSVAWEVGRWVGAGMVVMVVWAICYRFLPDTGAPFRVFTLGGLAGVVVWLGASYLFELYLGHFNRFEATYGTLGGAIVFLTWVWISNIALLFGAEVNDVVAHLHAVDDPPAAPLGHPLGARA